MDHRKDLSIPNAEAVDQSQPTSSRHANYFAALKTASTCRERQWYSARWITEIATGYGWISKKVIKEPMTSDPLVNIMNYVKFTGEVEASLATKRYRSIEDQRILPS